MLIATFIQALDSLLSNCPSFILPPSIGSLSQVVLVHQNLPKHCHHWRSPNKGELRPCRHDLVPFTRHIVVEELRKGYRMA
jgi:hypothetical protein